MITIIIGNTKCKVANLTDQKVIKAIDLQLSYDVQGFKFMKVGNNWDGKYRLLTKNHYFPIGMLPAVKNILNLHGYKYDIVDNRNKLAYGTPLDIDESSGFIPRDYQKEIVAAAWKHGGGIVRAATGCHRAGQGILLFNGTIKNVEDVLVGDQLMGPDSTPRTVTRLCRGEDYMVEIIPTKGKSFVVNEGHILSLKRTRRRNGDKRAGEISDVKVSDWYKWSDYRKHVSKLYRVPINFKNKIEHKISPYFLGLLLGDGSMKHDSVGITSVDDEIISEAYRQAENFNCYIRKYKIAYYFSKNKDTGRTNELINSLRYYNLIGTGSRTKFIPNEYKVSSEKDRLEILAGLMDSDGSMSNGGFEFISKSKKLADDTAFIARSLGLAAYVRECKKECVNNRVWGVYYRLSISGDCSIIPNRINRKKAGKRNQKKDVLVTGFKVRKLGRERYYGFQVDGDHRYLLDDFTVTHNSGKTLCIAMITAKFNVKTVIYVIGIELLYQMKETLNKAYPDVKVGMVGDGHCDIQDVTIATIWSAATAFGKKATIIDSDMTIDRKTKKMAEKNKEAVRKMVMEAELIVIDECQYAASETVQLLHRQSQSARHRFLFSGTPWRDSGDDLLIEAVGGPKIYDLNASTLINQGWLVQPKIYFLDVPVKRGVGKTYQEVYKNFIVENDIRNELIYKSAKRLVDRGRKVLVLVTNIAHGKELKSLLEKDLRVSSLDGTNKTADRMSTIQDMKNGKLDILIASKIFDQGIDIPELDALILAGSGKSSARALQRIGRVIRQGKNGSNKKDAIVVDFFDNCKYLREHTHIRNRIYSTEPRFEIIMPKRG